MKIASLKISFTAAIMIVLLIASVREAFARIGGGESYGGGGSSGGDGDGVGVLIWIIFELLELLIYLTFEYPHIGIPLDIIVVLVVAFYFFKRKKSSAKFSSVTITPNIGPTVQNASDSLSRLRKFDPNFSEIVFTDFAYALYAKAHHARGSGVKALELLSPYLSEAVRKSLLHRNPADIQEVKGIIIGSMRIAQVEGLETPLVKVGLVFESNYTEVRKSGSGKANEMTFYVVERWNLERKRDLLSPPPAQATALHCPRCGAPLQRDTVGACTYCGVKIDSGEFQWFVQNITLVRSEARGPMLTSDVPEVGTEFPSIVQPRFETVIKSNFQQTNPQFSWTEFQARVTLIFNELQAAWSNLEWERARPHETDNIFQMHQYWIEAYRRQGLRNVIENCVITGRQPVKILEDAFYQAITVRIWAQGNDYKIDNNGNVVSGSTKKIRRWSEYWTFIRHRSAKASHARAELSCPNCGSPLKVNASGICEFCGGKITSGEFDWVLSKIEQDESYAG